MDHRQQQRARFNNWMRTHAAQGSDACPVCGHTRWAHLDIAGMGTYAEPESMPFFPLMCDHCGYMRFFSAVKLGFTAADIVPNAHKKASAEPTREELPATVVDQRRQKRQQRR